MDPTATAAVQTGVPKPGALTCRTSVVQCSGPIDYDCLCSFRVNVACNPYLQPSNCSVPCNIVKPWYFCTSSLFDHS